MPITLKVNGTPRTLDVPADMPLLWALRDELDLKGTKFGCGIARCGACTVHVNGVATRSCNTPLSAAQGRQITTIEGLGNSSALHPLQQAFIDEQAGQCGYCLSGIQISAAALLARNPNPTDAEVRSALDRHLCRCGSHNRIVKAVLAAAQHMPPKPTEAGA